MSKKLSMDIKFDFEDDRGEIGKETDTCNVCRRRFRSHEISVHFRGWRGWEYGEKFPMNGESYGYSVLCADCILSSPAELAAKFRARAAEILRKPNTRRKQREEAEGMIELAGELEKVGGLRDLPGGIMASKIAEAYRELDGPRPQRSRKAA